MMGPEFMKRELAMEEPIGKAVMGAFVVGIFIGFCLGLWNATSTWHKACIDRGVAEYNQKTGVWQWKDNISTPVEIPAKKEDLR